MIATNGVNEAKPSIVGIQISPDPEHFLSDRIRNDPFGTDSGPRDFSLSF